MSVVSVNEPAAATKSPSLHCSINTALLFFLFSNAPALQLRGDTALERGLVLTSPTLNPNFN